MAEVAAVEVVADTSKNWLNKVTKNYPNNPLRPLEISQATYETLLLIYMNDMGDNEAFFWMFTEDATKQNNEYMKALGTFILGEAVADYLWPSNWLQLLHEELADVKKWHKALKNHEEANKDKQYVGTVIEALTKRTVLTAPNFSKFLERAANPVDRKFANLEEG